MHKTAYFAVGGTFLAMNANIKFEVLRLYKQLKSNFNLVLSHSAHKSRGDYIKQSGILPFELKLFFVPTLKTDSEMSLVLKVRTFLIY